MTVRSDILLDANTMMSGVIGPAGLEAGDVEALRPALSQIGRGLRDLRRLGQMPHQDLPYQEESARHIIEASKKIQDRFRMILLLGIGGSAQGAAFLKDSLAPGIRSGPSLRVCDFVDAAAWRQLDDGMDWENTLVLAVSKSGNTPETLAAFSFFAQRLKARVNDPKQHLFVITDPHEGRLRKIASENGIDSLEIPPGVGGRFSVLTAAGLFPAACLGIDILEILAGARRMDQRCVGDDPWSNPALLSAALHFLMDTRRGRKIRVLMPYGERLKSFAPWFAQLWAESLGKRLNLKGEEVKAGTTPVSAVGPQDQHSQLQMYLDGPEDKAITFVASEQEEADLILPRDFLGLAAHSGLGGKSVHHLLDAERRATARALSESQRPHQTILLREINPHTISQILYMAEMETVFAAGLYNVNPFDQPAVERVKVHIRDSLAGKL